MPPKKRQAHPPRPHRRERRNVIRRESDLVLAGLPAQYEELRGRVDRFEIGLAENTATTNKVKSDTSTIVAFVQDVETVWRFCKAFRRWSFRMAKWFAAIAGAFTAGAAALHAAGTIDVVAAVKGFLK